MGLNPVTFRPLRSGEAALTLSWAIINDRPSATAAMWHKPEEIVAFGTYEGGEFWQGIELLNPPFLTGRIKAMSLDEARQIASLCRQARHPPTNVAVLARAILACYQAQGLTQDVVDIAAWIVALGAADGRRPTLAGGGP